MKDLLFAVLATLAGVGVGVVFIAVGAVVLHGKEAEE